MILPQNSLSILTLAMIFLLGCQAQINNVKKLRNEKTSSSSTVINYSWGKNINTKQYFLTGRTSNNYVAKVADLDNDGKFDFVVGSTSHANVFLNNGWDGATAKPVTASYAANSTIYDIELVDVNGDNFKDLIYTNSASPNVSVRINNRAGGFGGATDLDTGANAYFVASGDIDGDSDIDLVVSAQGANQVRVLVNDGTGSFTGSNRSTGTSPGGIQLSDVEKDGDLDIVVTNTTANTISVHLNNGSGSFGAAVTYSHADITGPTIVITEDMDNDNYPDITVLGFSSVKIGVFRNNKDGTFTFVSSRDVPSNTYGLDVADYNNDGKMDVTITRMRSTHVSSFFKSYTSLYVGDATGDFSSASSYPLWNYYGSIFVNSGDIDNDGRMDIITGGYGADGLTNGYSGIVEVHYDIGRVTGNLKRTTNGSGVKGIVTADLNNDGYKEIISGCRNSNFITIQWNDSNKSNAFTTKNNYTVGSVPFEVVAEDFDKDGDIDIAVANTGSGSIQILSNDGTGTMTDGGTTALAGGSQPWDLKALDYDNDGDMDLFTVDWANDQIKVLTNTNGSFAVTATYASNNGYQLEFVDIDSDNDKDMLVVSESTNTVKVFKNDGSGAFTNTSNVATGNGPWRIAIGDIDGDGDIDFISGNNSAKSITIAVNDGSGAFTPTNVAASNLTVTDIALFDYDNDGDLDLAGSSLDLHTVGVLRNDGTGNFVMSNVLANVGGEKVPHRVLHEDLNNDGLKDLIIGNYGWNIDMISYSSVIQILYHVPNENL